MTDRMIGMLVFARTVEAGSFAAAASQLGMSAQMAGKHVRALEERLGTRLLNRSTHSQSLTEAGRLYLDGCKAVLSAAEAADASVASQTGNPQGTLRLTAPVGIGSGQFVRILTRFLDAYPKISVELHLTDRLVNVVEEGFDAAIRIGWLPDSTLVARSLGSYRVVTCASPAYLAAHGSPETPRDLIAHVCLDFTFPVYPAPCLWTFALAGSTYDVQPKSRLVINDGRALIEAALTGFGIIQIGEYKVADDLADGRLVRLLPGYTCPARPIHLVFASQTKQTPKLRALIDFLVDAFMDVS